MSLAQTRWAPPGRKALAGGLRRVRRGVRSVFGTRFVKVPDSDDELCRDYRRDGYVAGGRVLDNARLERLRHEFERIMASLGRADCSIEHERVTDGDGGEFFKIYNLHRASDPFLELVTDPTLTALLRKLSGCEGLRVLLDQIQYKPAGTGGRNGWHRDMPSFPLIEPYTALTAWVPLDDATEDNGALVMVPGSHRWGDCADIAVNDWGLDLSGARRRYHGHRVRNVSRPIPAGHVHVHDQWTWHSSPPNRTAGKRRALAIHCFDADARYREGGAISYPELRHGDSMEAVAPLVLR